MTNEKHTENTQNINVLPALIRKKIRTLIETKTKVFCDWQRVVCVWRCGKVKKKLSMTHVTCDCMVQSKGVHTIVFWMEWKEMKVGSKSAHNYEFQNNAQQILKVRSRSDMRVVKFNKSAFSFVREQHNKSKSQKGFLFKVLIEQLTNCVLSTEFD